MNKYIQIGYFEKYPKEFLEENLWDLNKPVPTWLSDYAKVLKLESDGTIILDTKSRNTGDLEIYDQSGKLLVILPKDGYLIYSNKRIYGITKKQLELLYYKK